MKIKALNVLILAFLCSNLMAQFNVYGTVTDEDGTPYPNMRIVISETDFETITDEGGEFLFEGVPEGEYAVVFFHEYGEVYKALYLYDEDENLDVQIRRRIEFDEIIVQSTRVSKSMPMTSEFVDNEEIEEFNFGQDVPFLMRSKTSVVTTSDAGTGIGYTGIRIRGVDPTHVNVTINGIPLNDSESQLVFWVDLPGILSSTENLQIQRGLGPSSPGASDLGASVNLNTNKINTKSYATVKGQLGSFNTYGGSLALGTGLMNGKFALDGRVSYTHSDGYIDRATADLRSFFISGAYLGLRDSYRFNVINGHEVTYQAWNGVPVNYADDKDLRTFNSAGTERIKQVGDTPHDNEVDNYTQTHYQFFYNRMHDNGSSGLTLHYTRGLGFFELYQADEDLRTYPIPTLPDSIDIGDMIQRRWLDNHFYGLILNRSFETGRMAVDVGLSGNNYSGKHYGEIFGLPEWEDYRKNGADPFEYYSNDAQKLDAQVYTRATYSLNNKWSLYGDLQYRFVNYSFEGYGENGSLEDLSKQFNFFNPKLGLTYLLKGGKIFASYALGNKEPNRNDFRDAGPLSRPQAERLHDIELGYEFSENGYSIAAHGYYMKYQNQLVLTGKINDVGEYARLNVEDSYRLGLELMTSGKIFDGLSWYANATLSRNRIDRFVEFVDTYGDDWGEYLGQTEIEHSDTEISFSPSIIANFNLKYDFSSWLHVFNEQDNLTLALVNNYIGKQYLDNTTNDNAALDPYLTTDLVLGYGLKYKWLKNLQWQFKVVNLFDQFYSANGWIYRFQANTDSLITGDPFGRPESGNSYNQTGLYPQAGIHFFTGLTVKF